MFDSKKKKPLTEVLGQTNRIVAGTVIKGDIVSEADFRFDGELIGNFQSTGKLVIGPAGIITGDVVCLNADIEGTFKGNIQVTELLNIKEQANINGQVSVGKLSVEPGANFTGTCKMNTNGKEIPLNNESKELLKKSV